MSGDRNPLHGLLALWYLARKLQRSASADQRPGGFDLKPYLRIWMLFFGLVCVCPVWARQLDGQEWLCLGLVVAVVIAIRIATRRWRQ